MNKLSMLIASTIGGLIVATASFGQAFQVEREGTFVPQKKTVRLLKHGQTSQKVLLFQTTLRVNTDGSPRSYHPDDLYANKHMALNNICNAVAVRTQKDRPNLCLQKGHYTEAVEAFRKYKKRGYANPPGYLITWQNVLAPTTQNGRSIPCVFSLGKFAGYYGSLTHLHNGLSDNKGECDKDDQLDAEAIPSLVMAGGANILKTYGAKVGDLLVAYDPKTKKIVAAVIGDSGPTTNLGEGSIRLNSLLSGLTEPPTDYKSVKKLGIEDRQIMIAILPASKDIELKRPYTGENISVRVAHIIAQFGFNDDKSFVDALRPFLK